MSAEKRSWMLASFSFVEFHQVGNSYFRILKPNMEDAVYKSMPKVELHAHLNGSISEETLRKLVTENGLQMEANHLFHLEKSETREFTQCFAVFKLIHDIIRTPEILKRVTSEVINDFADDNVVYLELRTTPKKVHEIPSKKLYLESVINAIVECQQSRDSILVKLLISIDREKGAIEGSENVDLAVELAQKYPNIVVGMDLSGNPTIGHFEWILPLLERARGSGLKLTCHLPEVKNLEETNRLLEFDGIGRLGHGLYLHPLLGGTTEQWELMKQKKIPIEVCITSNIISGVTKSLDRHYVSLLNEEGIPFVICTDDSGVFNTTLSQEYLKFSQIVRTSFSKLRGLCVDSVSFAFCTEEEKHDLRDKILKWWDQLIERHIDIANGN